MESRPQLARVSKKCSFLILASAIHGWVKTKDTETEARIDTDDIDIDIIQYMCRLYIYYTQ